MKNTEKEKCDICRYDHYEADDDPCCKCDKGSEFKGLLVRGIIISEGE